jgi:hypothetical protein
MTRDESLQVVEMVLSGWPSGKEWGREEIDMYARSIQDLDAELATHTVLKMIKDTQYRPSVVEVRERVYQERRALRRSVEPKDDPAGVPLPFWVQRWICARMLYKQFGKERDMRRFPEAGDHGDMTKELMPEGAWVKEAESMDDKGFHTAFQKMFKTGF